MDKNTTNHPARQVTRPDLEWIASFDSTTETNHIAAGMARAGLTVRRVDLKTVAGADSQWRLAVLVMAALGDAGSALIAPGMFQ